MSKRQGQEEENVIFVQFSDKLLTPDSVMRDYYRRAYSKMEGYYFPEHYMEIPFWIPTIAGMLPDQRYHKELHIVEDINASITSLTERKRNVTDVFLFSVMDANVNQVHVLAQLTEKRMVLGGYTNPAEFSHYKNVHYLSDLGQLPQVFEEVYIGVVPPDYSLFEGEKCIPRLTLSTGCLFRCTFCTVPLGLTLLSEEEISMQVEALRPLDFKLIFIDDKSFGQAKNWRLIGQVNKQVKSYNPEFLGFIVQTPPTLVLKDGLLEESLALGVRYIELGVETVNDQLLEMFKKPYRIKHLEAVCDKVRKLGVRIIPNFILGIPGDDYQETINWVAKNRDIIPVVNINFLAVHYDNERGILPIESKTVGDRDQNVAEKSWFADDEVVKMKDAMRTLYDLTIDA